MLFSYSYKTSDNVRHEASIEAASRDDAFAALREKGIKPIKVEAVDGGSRGRAGARPSLKVVVLIVLAACIVGGVAWWFGRRGGDNAPYQVMTPQGPVTYSVAQPLARQRIAGDRSRIETAMVNVGGNREADGRDGARPSQGIFQHAAEEWLARFAEPGRDVSGKTRPKVPPSAAEFVKCLKQPIRIANTDFTEVIDLKRIVTGMKLEMRAYLAGGGTVEQYLAELEKRQRLEISYRDNAQRRLDDMIKGIYSPTANPKPGTWNSKLETRNPEPGTRDDQDSKLREAYSYWLKANAHLQAMGIYPLPLPDALRSYQMGLDIEE